MSDCARYQCVRIMLDADRGMYHQEICRLVKAARGTTTEALRWLSRNGFLVKEGRKGLAFYTPTGKVPQQDGRGRNPKSWVGLVNGRYIGIAAMNSAKYSPKESPPIHSSPLAQALAWTPRPTIQD